MDDINSKDRGVIASEELMLGKSDAGNAHNGLYFDEHVDEHVTFQSVNKRARSTARMRRVTGTCYGSLNTSRRPSVCLRQTL